MAALHLLRRQLPLKLRLQANNLIQILEAERDELEIQGIYYDLF